MIKNLIILEFLFQNPNKDTINTRLILGSLKNLGSSLLLVPCRELEKRKREYGTFSLVANEMDKSLVHVL